MKRINTEEINGKNFIGMWDIENDNLLKNIIDFFNNNHESHKPGTIALGKTDKNKKDLLELTINPKQVKENKIEIFIKSFSGDCEIIGLQVLGKCFACFSFRTQ